MDLIEKAKNFTDPNRKWMSWPVVKNGHVYASDGKTLFKAKVGDAVADNKESDLPDAIEKLIAEIDPVKSAAPAERFKIVKQSVLETEKRYQEKLAEYLNGYDDGTDYTEMTCPCCGSTVYSDGMELFEEDKEEEVRKEEDFIFPAEIEYRQFDWRRVKKIFDAMPGGTWRMNWENEGRTYLICETADAYALLGDINVCDDYEDVEIEYIDKEER